MVRDRINRRIATDAVVMQTVVVQAMAGGKGLEKLLRDLLDDG